MIRLLLLLMALASPAGAQVTRVATGEHDGFSRLVFTFAAAQRWSLQRTADGYVLDTEASSPGYDLSRVFDRIPRDRLSAIWVEPSTGVLRLRIGCACHAAAFDLRPGLVVLDLRDGPAPPDSPFEVTADGLRSPDLAADTPRRPLRRPLEEASGARPAQLLAGYDWLASSSRPPALPEANDVPSTLPETPEVMAVEADLRAEMLAQLARGASRGVVEMALPAAPASGAMTPPNRMDQVEVHATSGLAVRADDARSPLTGTGAACPPDDALALADWGDDRPVAEALSRRTAALTGEFDKPDPAMNASAVRYLLHLGFGTEARQIMKVMLPELPTRPLWEGLAHVLDDEADPAQVFAGMEVCDGPAVLWAVLSAPTLPSGSTLERAAVLRHFSALPLHLRRDLGPRLAERFLRADDLSAARAVQEAILRAPGTAGPAADLMVTRLEAAEGAPASAERLETLGAHPGVVGVEATLMAVEAALAADAPPDPALAAAVEALLREYNGAREGPALRRATALLRARLGDEAGAFALADAEVALEIWQVLANRGTDGALLEAAVGTRPPENLNAATRRKIAERLISLGLPDPALEWLSQGEAAEDLALAARAHVARGDGRSALRVLGGREVPEAAQARAQALGALGDPAAAEAFAALEDAEGLARAQQAASDWEALAANGPEAWAAAAALAGPIAPSPDEGPLARSARLVAGAEATRSRLAELLATTAAGG